jgi:uroporphyrinogen decarboxylase
MPLWQDAIRARAGGLGVTEILTDRRAEFSNLVHGESERAFLTSAWQHFVGEEYDPVRFAAATVEFNRIWDWDWVKINPRAVYYAEAWGAVYDPDDYRGVVPQLVSPGVASTADLAKVKPLDPRANPAFAEQLASARLIRDQIADRAVIQTVFSPLSVLLQLADLPFYPGADGHLPDAHVDFLRSDPTAVHAALSAIAQTLADYVAALVGAADADGVGLDGIFYAVTGTASGSYFSQQEFAQYSAPYDSQVLAAAGDSVVVLHTCRADSHPQWFTGYRIDALQWDQFLPGNPPLDVDLGVTPIGGVSNELFAVGADPAPLIAQLEQTLAAGPSRPFLLSPSCTIPTPADPAALQRLRAAH